LQSVPNAGLVRCHVGVTIKRAKVPKYWEKPMRRLADYQAKAKSATICRSYHISADFVILAPLSAGGGPHEP
jgi:hypothetical protein